MKTHQANIINSLTLIIIGLWGYFAVSNWSLTTILAFEEWTALIPVLFGIILYSCTNGIKNENKLIAHIAVFFTLLIFIALAFKRLPISIEQGGTGLLRVIAMTLTSLIACIVFVMSFIQARKNK